MHTAAFDMPRSKEVHGIVSAAIPHRGDAILKQQHQQL